MGGVMAAATAGKACRMDIRLTQLQRKNYEKAAELRGPTLSQWTTMHLDECARRDIDEAHIARLSDELVPAHLPLPVQHVPEPLAIRADVACKLRDADASVFASFLNDISCLQGVFRALLS